MQEKLKKNSSHKIKKIIKKLIEIISGGYGQFAALKTYNRDLKTLIAIGGWNEGSRRFSPLVADASRRKTFIRSALRFLR